MERRDFRLLRRVPPALQGLDELALDLRWTWNHAADALWARLDWELWNGTQNAWFVLQNVPSTRLDALAQDAAFVASVEQQVARRRDALARESWFDRATPAPSLGRVAYFSMEFGLSEALPLYSGGLGVLAGDTLKSASDLGVPMVGVGLLYQSGYFRQAIDASGAQQALYPYNNPMLMPIVPRLGAGGEWMHVKVALPGRLLRLRCWEATVGRATLLLLDSNDPLNSPGDRSITGELYDDAPERRLQQQIALGIGGYRLLEALGLHCNVLHLNEGHAALAVLERARAFMHEHAVDFDVALTCTRAGNLFTTHTAVPDAFDRYRPELFAQYFKSYARELRLDIDQLLALGRLDPHARDEPFTLPWLAVRGAGGVNGVSRLHGRVSRSLFQPLFPRCPSQEVPITHVTNGVHVPSWDSEEADRIWEDACGKERWLEETEALERDLRLVSDEALWALRNASAAKMVAFVRERATCQRAAQGVAPEQVAACARLLDPSVLTLGFARRFARYKRPNLLLREPARLARLLRDAQRPVQLVLAGKAHPNDPFGNELLRAWNDFMLADDSKRVVFIEDYDLAVAQKLVQGVDVWLNTPRVGMEACGTSGMKVLVNGGLNLSVADGWWAEFFSCDVGFAIDGVPLRGLPASAHGDVDAHDAEALFEALETRVIPAFYDRDRSGIPRGWTALVRESMAKLTPACSANRMLREYTSEHYAKLAQSFEARALESGELGAELERYRQRMIDGLGRVAFGRCSSLRTGDQYAFEVAVQLGALQSADVAVELFALGADERPIVIPLRSQRHDAAGWVVYEGLAPAERPASHYTPRVRPSHPLLAIPLELSAVAWRD